MGSFKANGREQGSRERRNIKHARRRGLLNLEWLLEERVLLSVVWHPTSTNLADVENGPMANLGGQAISLYKAFQGGQTNSSALAKQFPLDQFQGDSVLMGLTAYTDFQGFKTSLSNLGMQIVDTNPTDGLVDGWLPINELPTAAQLPQTMSGQPDMRDVTYQAAINEADYSTFANVASKNTGLTGAGVTVGVISDSFNNQGGYAADVASGDLPSNVDVLAEATAADKGYPFDDEGRAMAQNIYHIASGASLAFATGEPDSQVMAQNILKLAYTAGAKVIVDDLGLPDEPFFQPGLVTQAINTVTSQGVTYLSAAGNEANHGYLSNFRAATGTVTGVGTGTFMNFNPSGTSLLLPITVNEANTSINFQFDQPWKTQEPMGSPGPTSQVDFYVLNAAGTIIASGTNNNVATGVPQQLVTVPTTGSYYVAIQLVSGPNPGHVEFTQFGQVSADDLIVSQQYGSAGGTYYPTSVGHNASANNIGVGAVPWWSPTPFLGQKPLASEPFSSSGPEIQVFNASGTALSSPLTVQNPTVTAPDGGNITSNWPASMPFGIVANTANPPFQGEPATSSSLYATFTPNQSKLPSYFGTSSAAPNAAAIAALMLQRVSSATPAQIKDALIESAAATPMNASAPGTWNAQGGYGLINAINAIDAIDVLRVSSTNPSNGETVTVTPSAIDVTFTKPVVFSTVTSSDLVFQATPPGVSVVVGTPQAIDNPTDPTIVAFPYSFSYKNPPTTTANGVYTFIVSGPIMAETGGTLVPSSPITFTLDDTTAPEVANTSVSTRTVTIQFTKAMNPSTIKLANLYVERQGGTGNWLTPINLNSYPGVTIAYNPLTNTATLNYSALPQTDMPTDDYAIVVKSGPTGVTDLVGNELDGAFSGTFPSGNGTPGTNFFEDLGLKTLVAPVLTTFQMTPATDTGIAGDQNTNLSRPQFIGQVYNSFPGTVANLSVYVEFNGLHPALNGGFDLAMGGGGRGHVGNYDILATTNSVGTFTIAPPALPEGYQRAQVVVVGAVDQPGLAGLSSSQQYAFRIDKTPPTITGIGQINGAAPPSPPNLSLLQSLTLDVQDPVNQAYSYLATPAQVIFPALEASTAANISNYSLILLNANGTQTDESQYITTASFTATPPTLTGQDIADYNGVINLTFSTGIPAGNYELIAHTKEQQYPGLLDAAGNPLASHFVYNFSLQSQPAFITNIAMESTYSNNGSTAIGGPRSYYELPTSTSTSPVPNYVARAEAPPTAWVVDLSNPIPFVSAGYYNNKVQLIGSANTYGGTPDGNFGDLGEGGLGSTDPASGFNIVPGTTVTLYSYNATTQQWSQTPTGGSGTRMVLSLASGSKLAADYYRLYIPNQVNTTSTGTKIDSRIYDIYGNQLDGEFLGDATSTLDNSATGFPAQPPVSTQFSGIFNYEDELSTGVYRQGMSGDGVAGGAFMTSFVVVPPATLSASGEVLSNIVYARPDYVEDPLLPSTAPDGSLAKPYSTLAPEGDPATAPANPNHDPNGGLNSSQFFLSGFNPQYDRNGNGVFDRSALYAASQLAYRGPVVVIALPGTPQLNPITGVVTQRTFVLTAPAGSNPVINNASISVPFDTTLVFAPGSALKSQNASLFVQNQGSALEVLGGSTPSTQVNFTSYNDASIGGASNNNPDTTPRPGDWGGIVFRSYDEAITANQVQFPVDGVTQGINGPAISGEDDGMSIISNAVIQYGGGAVPQSSGTFYSAITLYNARPAITNDKIANNGGTGGLEAAIGADMDSFREDDEAWGPLIRRTSVANNSLNGIWLLAESGGFIEPTNAVPLPDNPTMLGGSQNYVFFEPLPLIVLAQIAVGQELEVNTGGTINYVQDRLYVQPGAMLKFGQGAGLDLLNPGASLNVGSRSYITGYDKTPGNEYGPTTPGFVAESASDPQVLFTSIHDDAATTTLVPTPINVTGETSSSNLAPGSWGSVGIQSGAIAVINAATFQYGGGAMNTQTQTIPSQSVLSFLGAFSGLGTRVYITNNNFYHNFDAAMQIDPNGLLAGDPLHPLVSGHPFLRGNVLQNNGIDGLAVVTSREYLLNADQQYIGPIEANLLPNYEANQTVSTVWDLTDITYVLRGTIVLGGAYSPGYNGPVPTPSATYSEPPSPTVSLTIQAALPGTLLADGETIPNPGASVVVKLLSENTANGAGSLTQYGSTGLGASEEGGAGFIAGVDDTVDNGTTSPLVDPGAYSQIRILGIPGDQTTGQQRVPVILTSLRDDTVGVTARGVKMYDIFNSYPVGPYTPYKGQSLTTPAAGDGGYIYIGGNSLTTYNLTDPREGSLIDNADLSYMTRIEIQGGGIVDETSTVTDPGVWQTTKTGYGSPLEQLNTAMAVRISGSNINAFADAGVFVHPMSANALVRTVSATGATAPVRGTLKGEGVTLYMYNDTISNTPQGINAEAESVDDSSGESPMQLVLLNNTFYKDRYAIQTIAPQYNFATTANGQNLLSHVVTLAMDNIFDGSSIAAVDIEGNGGNSTLEYNLFFNNTKNVVAPNTGGFFLGNAGAVFGNPEFVDAATGNFELQPDSAAINAARSEIGPIPGADAIYPTVDQLLSDQYGTRTDPATVPYPEQPGASNVDGGFGDITDPRQILTLPGSGEFSFQDEWVPALTTAANSYGGPSTGAAIPGTYNYTPISGQRDALGLIRIDDPSVPITGYGKYPFFAIGAYQYVNLHPPDVTGVTATIGTSTTPVNFYTVGGKSGANQTPKTIDVQFNSPIDPSTLNSSTVELEALGVTGNNVPGTLISLAGKISYDSATFTLVISLGASGLVLKTDAYQLILIGSGSQVIASPQGIALSGANLSDNDDPKTGTQLPLPSGNGLPGSNFYDNFIINTTPPIVTSSTFMLAPASDTNIVGDYVTMTTLPSFVGSITEPNSALVPLAGQTAILDIGIAEVTSTGTTIYYADSPNIPTALLPYLRDDAGTALTDANGNFTVTVGVDGAGTGLVTNTTPLPSSPYNVGSTGMLTPLPGTVSGYYVARVRVKDQSGNVSNAATAPFVVDTVPPVVTVASPANNSVINPSTASLTFVVDADKNLDLTHFTTAQIQLLESAPDGSFTGTGTTTIAINPTITPDYLDKGIGGPGAETLSFTTAALTNGLYQLTLIGTGSNSIRDIAGNTPGGNIVGTFAVFNPSIITSVFVGPASFVTEPTASEGDRANPFPTISDALAKAAVGERIEVLPGVYTENVTLPPFVSIVSADPSSTDTSYVPGDALSTIIRAPAVASATTNVTVTATNLSSFVNSSTGQVFETEVGGFAIASPLVGNPATGPINPNAVGLLATNSNLLIDRDYFIDAGDGILVTTSGASSQAPQIENDAIIGNINGVVVQDNGASNPATTTEVINNTFAFNTNGLVALNDAATGSEQAYVANNIFWQNHDQTPARSGVGVTSQTVNKLVLNNNLFSGNGASDTSTAYAAVNIGNGFDPTKLGPLAANAAADLGNFTGYPAFVAPYDPRPGSDGPATFFLDANFGLLSTSAAINNALESVVPVYDGLHTDLLGNLENPNPTTAGFHLPGYGPRDVGAFEYEPPGTTGTTAVGGAFRVVTTSLVPDGSTQADGSTLYVSPAPTPTPAPTPVLPPPITPAPAPSPTAPPKKKDTAPVKKLKVVASPKPKPKTTTATSISRKPPTFPGKSATKK